MTFLLLLASSDSFAQSTCTGSARTETLALPSSITIPRGDTAAVGTLLTGWVSSPATTNYYRCTIAGTVTSSGMAFAVASLSPTSTKVRSEDNSTQVDVWQTNISGIGIAITFRAYANGCRWAPWGFKPGEVSGLTGDWGSSFGGACNGPSPQTNGGQLQVALVKTGSITAGGTLSLGTIGSGRVLAQDSRGTFAPYTDHAPAAHINYAMSSVTVSAPTCRVTTTRVAIPLTSTAGISTRTFTGIGTGSNWTTDVPIQLDCTGVAANVYMTVTDATNPANTSSFLSLTRESTATGVEIELSVSGTPKMSFGPDSAMVGNINQFRIANATGPSARINLSARYVQRTARVTSGTANGAATFTMAYQ